MIDYWFANPAPSLAIDLFQFQMGNQDGFNDIDSQRKSENSYRFSLDEQIKRQEV